MNQTIEIGHTGAKFKLEIYLDGHEEMFLNNEAISTLIRSLQPFYELCKKQVDVGDQTEIKEFTMLTNFFKFTLFNIIPRDYGILEEQFSDILNYLEGMKY